METKRKSIGGGFVEGRPDPESKLRDDKVDKVHIYLIIPLEPQHSVKAPNVSRISLTGGRRHHPKPYSSNSTILFA